MQRQDVQARTYEAPMFTHRSREIVPVERNYGNFLHFLINPSKTSGYYMYHLL
jgi:hypothetical protein